MEITWIGHASVKIKTGETVIYIDPFAGENYDEKADLILITHEHYDHFNKELIEKIRTDDTVIFAAPSVAAELHATSMQPGSKNTFQDIQIEAVEAYNLSKSFHPQGLGVGFILAIEGKRVYHAGDTDLIPEMNMYEVDIAFLPVGGTYTMDAREAAAAINVLSPTIAIPIHWGEIVGQEEDALHFKEEVERESEVEVRVLKKGETSTL